jgi:hypothetical protein
MTGPVPEEALLQFLYALPVAIWQIDRDDRIGLISARAANLLQELGLTIGQGSGLGLLRALDAALAAQVEAHWLTPGLVVARQRLQRTDVHGRPRPLAVTAQVINAGQVLVTVEEAWEAGG